MTMLDDFDGLLHWPQLQQWIESSDCPGSGPVLSVTPLAGGSQNALFLFERADAKMVMRRPPRAPRPDAAKSTAREATVLRALGETDVDHPRLYAHCEDVEVTGVAFIVTEHVDGFTPLGQLPEQYASDPSWRHEMAIDMTAGIARLGLVDPGAIGLTNFGRPEGWLDRQVSRYRAMLESYLQLDGYDEIALSGIDTIGRWLDDNLPDEHRIGIVHGDFQFANVMVCHERPKLSAILDWDMASQGDPMLDLAWMLTAWSEPGDPAGRSPVLTPATGFPSRAEVVEEYGRLTGRSMDAFAWFQVLACYRLAVLLEGTNARAASGQAPKDVGKTLHDTAIWLMTWADQLIRGT